MNDQSFPHAGGAIANPLMGEQKIKPGPLEKIQIADPWVHRSDGMRCRTCIWFVSKVTDRPVKPEAPIVGRCRRHAPTMGGYPVVYQTDWCGDHRLDENKV